MSFLTALFHNEKKAESVTLIDIGTSSVAGAYARYTEDESPILLYTRRVPIEVRVDEPLEQAMLRSLGMLGELLIREGAPILSRATGRGNTDIILVSIDAPWQDTSLRIEHFEEPTLFKFTKSMVTEQLEKTRVAATGKLLADESIIGTILNGYETDDPYGREVHRASVVVLTSLIDEAIAKNVLTALQGFFHTKHILPIAGSSLRYQAIRRAFPHERDALIIDATGPVTSIALVRKDLFVAIVEVPHEAGTGDTWIGEITGELAELAKNYPLPRTIFLVARETAVSSLQETLTTANLGELWLSDNPPKIVSVLASHIVGLVRQAPDVSPDLLLLLMALFWRYRGFEESM